MLIDPVTEIVWLPLTVRLSFWLTVHWRLLPMLPCSFCPTLSVRLLPMVTVSSCCTFRVWSCSTTIFRSFSACRKISSLPILSSNRSSLKLAVPPPFELRLKNPLCVELSGSVYGTPCCSLYTRPTTKGLSGSPSRKSTTTSCPIRGIQIAPQFFPAQGCDTRIQHELFSSFVPSRSQKNWTFTRPY